jgi:Domain of unknown function (DUF4157)
MAELRSQAVDAQQAEAARRPTSPPGARESDEIPVGVAAAVQRANDAAPSAPVAADLPTLQRLAGNRAVGRLVEGAAPAQRAAEGTTSDRQRNDTGLPDTLKSGVESLSGVSLDDVNVRFDSTEPPQVGAVAYTQGRDIHVAPGQERHLPHEAWHVVQQAQGRVSPTTETADGVAVNDDRGLEREADEMGARAQSGPAHPRAAEGGASAPSRDGARGADSPVVQRVVVSVDNYRELMAGQAGNFTLGEATKTQANKIGADWVGKPVIGYATVSDDGLRQFRKAAGKKKTGRTQANVEARAAPAGQFTTNGHITIVAAGG